MTITPQYPHQKVHAFLRHHPMAVLSTVSGEGKPWGAAIYYVADDEFNFYFVTRAETYKYQNIENQPYVALTIADTATQTTVQLAGKVEPLPTHRYMEVFFDKFAGIRPEGEQDWAPPLEKIHAGNYIPLHLKPTKLQFADYGHRKADAHADYIEQIIPAAK